MSVNAKKETFLKLTAVLYVIAALNFLANYFHLYYILWWFDIPMHFLGGFWLGGMAAWFYFFNDRINGKLASSGTARKLVFYFTAVMVVSLAWEIFEFSLDTFIVSRANDIMDTLSDLSMDALGAMAALLISLFGRLGRIKQPTNDK